jgi:hypothetical protein
VSFVAGYFLGGLAQPDEYSAIDHECELPEAQVPATSDA